MKSRELLNEVRQKGIRPKKALGQNFLIDDRVVERIVSCAQLDPSSWVLEVGGGHGALSLALAESCGRLVVVEKDPLLYRHLVDLLGRYPHVEVVEADVLDLDLKTLLPEGAVVVSNLPYSISSPFMFKLWDEAKRVDRFVLMFQKEVAERITASSGTKAYGVLSVLFSLVFSVKVLFSVSKNAFWPRPEVDSTVLYGVRERVLEDNLAKVLKRILNAGFPYRRKKIYKALSFSIPEINWKEVLEKAGVDADLRPDALTPQQWLAVAQYYKNLLNRG